MTEIKTYSGGCHCGKVRFEVKANISTVMSCNCSICQKTGTLLAFVSADDFKLQAGEDHLTDYQFAKMKIHHRFCSTCGVRSFANGLRPDGQPMYAVNVRCLDEIDLKSLQLKEIDGRSF
jgi:hypothetical protein